MNQRAVGSPGDWEMGCTEYLFSWIWKLIKQNRQDFYGFHWKVLCNIERMSGHVEHTLSPGPCALSG